MDFNDCSHPWPRFSKKSPFRVCDPPPSHVKRKAASAFAREDWEIDLHQNQAGQHQNSAEIGARQKHFTSEEERNEAGEDWLEAEDDADVGRCGVLLGNGLDDE